MRLSIFSASCAQVNGDGFSVLFSYGRAVALWSPATGAVCLADTTVTTRKHINACGGRGARRLSEEEFATLLECLRLRLDASDPLHFTPACPKED